MNCVVATELISFLHKNILTIGDFQNRENRERLYIYYLYKRTSITKYSSKNGGQGPHFFIKKTAISN